MWIKHVAIGIIRAWNSRNYGYVIRLQCIYNFCCSMLILYHFAHVLYAFYCIYLRFLWLTYYQDAQCQFPIFCCFLFLKSYTGNILGIARDENPRPYIAVTYTDTEGETEGGCGAPWYVSNVSIISDVPCSYYIICHMFYMHFIAFIYVFLD